MRTHALFAAVIIVTAAPMLAIGASLRQSESGRAPVSTATPPPATQTNPAQANTPLATGLLSEAIDWDALIGPPPDPSSKEAFADLAIVRFEQARRCPPEIDAAWRGVALAPNDFDQALSARFDPEFTPRLYTLVERAIAEVRAVNGKLKKTYSRPRPFMADPSIVPCLPKEEGNSYPSSHATRGMAIALILAGVFPERREALLQFGRVTGYSRVVGGVHYPSDVDAGFRIAERATREILESEVWRAALAECGAEIAKVRADMVPAR